jgi:CheY-like chemotaxis protein
MAGRILVLDDEENYAEMLQELLREHDYRVDMATRPERAILQLEEIPYDLVISDYKMPVLDGADFLKKARELYPNLPFILVSGLMNTPELVKVANMSVTLVLEKPLNTETFLEQVARFSEPMTPQDKEQLAKEADSASSGGLGLSCPEEPRFFSASHYLAAQFMQKAWSKVKDGRELFIHEPIGGDAALAIKDLSHWRGNGDRLVDILTLPSTNEEALRLVEEALSDPEKSPVLGFRLTFLSEIARARQLTELAQAKGSDATNSLLLVYVLSAAEGLKQFEEATSGEGVILPGISMRPSDLAVYARRIARISAERAGYRQSAGFSPEAGYALLAYDWPRNYKQIQEVVQAAVSASQEHPISYDAFCEALGQSVPTVEPDQRLGALMQSQQGRYLQRQMDAEGLVAEELAQNLELDTSVQTKDDWLRLPLLSSELGSL